MKAVDVLMDGICYYCCLTDHTKQLGPGESNVTEFKYVYFIRLGLDEFWLTKEERLDLMDQISMVLENDQLSSCVHA